MICYKDKTFCSFKECALTKSCSRFLTEEMKKEAIKSDLLVDVFSTKPDCYSQIVDNKSTK